MTDYPERLHICYYDGFHVSEDSLDGGSVEYIRADLVPTWRNMDSAPKSETRILCIEDKFLEPIVLMFKNGDFIDMEQCAWTPIKWMPIPQ
jgi:hypothetical protein